MDSTYDAIYYNGMYVASVERNSEQLAYWVGKTTSAAPDRMTGDEIADILARAEGDPDPK